MGYLSLYRKWRPRNFSDIVGQDNVIKTLKNAIKLDRISHAYLFCGPRGTGKTSTAKILAKSLNCREGPTINPCEDCEPCQKIQDNSSIDVLEIDAASNRGIDEIRELREKVKFSPTEGSYKVYIIDEAHMLTKEAFNALLKTLEEPPEYVIFILATTEPHSLLPTILSRCQRFDFSRLSVQNMIERLEFICQQEEIELNAEAAVAIARNAEGGMRDAISILDQVISYAGNQVELDDVATVLGLVEEKVLSKMVEIVTDNKVDKGLKLIRQIINQGKDIQQFVSSLINHFRNLLVQKECREANELIELPSEQFKRIKQQSSKLTIEELLRGINILIELETQLKQSDQPRILLEMGIIKLMKSEVDTSREGILNRLTKLENKIKDEKVVISNNNDRNLQQVQEQVKEEVQEEVKKEKKVKKKKQQSPNKEVDQKSQQDNFHFSEIKDKWSDVLEYIKSDEPMTHAVLREADLVALEGKKIVLAFDETKSFHKENVERKKQEIEKIIKEVLDKDMSIDTIFSKNNNYRNKGNSNQNKQAIEDKSKKTSGNNSQNETEIKNRQRVKQDNQQVEKSQEKPEKDKKNKYSQIKEEPLVREVLDVFDGEILKVKQD